MATIRYASFPTEEDRQVAVSLLEGQGWVDKTASGPMWHPWFHRTESSGNDGFVRYELTFVAPNRPGEKVVPKKYSSPDISKIYENVVRRSNGCWEWVGACSNGRPVMYTKKNGRKKRVNVRKTIYNEKMKRPWPSSQHMYFHCDCVCVNPKCASRFSNPNKGE